MQFTCFLYHGQFYEQLDGVAMVSLLFPVIENFHMEAVEKYALQQVPYKPALYVDDTLLIWSHGMKLLEEFVTF